MGNFVYVDRARYIAVADAASAANLSSDYVARLCREQKVASTRVGKHWFVSEESLKAFIDRQKQKDEQRRDELAAERRMEYHLAASAGLHRLKPEAGVASTLAARAAFVGSHEATSGVPAYMIHPALDFLHKVTALITALSLVFGTYAFADRETAREVIVGVQQRSQQIHSALSREFLSALVVDARNVFAMAVTDPHTAVATSQVAMTAAAGGTVDGLARRWNVFVDTIIFGAMFDVAPAPRIVSPQQTPSTVQLAATTTSNSSRSAEGTSGNVARTVQYVTQPIVERVVETQRVSVVGGVSEAFLTERLDEIRNDYMQRILATGSANSTYTSQVYNVVSQTNKIDNLGSVDITNSTITGGTITGATISGGSVTATGFDGVLGIGSGGTGTSSSPTYGKVLLGNSAGGYDLVATSTLGIGAGSGSPSGAEGTVQFNASGLFSGDSDFSFNSSINLLSVAFASSTALSALDSISVGRTSTTTIRGDGVASTLPFASTTAITATTASTTNLIVSSAGGSGTRCLQVAADGTVSANASACGSGGGSSFGQAWEVSGGFLAPTTTNYVTNIQQASSTNFSALQTWFGATATSSFSSAGVLTLAGSLNGPLHANAGVVAATTSIGAVYGGTGQTSFSVGDILYASAAGTLSKLAIGSSGDVLKVSGGVPSWGTDLQSAGSAGGTWATTTSQVSGTLVNYSNNTSDVIAIGSNSTTTAEYWFDPNTTRAFFSGNLGIGTTSPYSKLSVVGETVSAFFTATTSQASTFPYASTTAITATTASTTNLVLSSAGGSGTRCLQVGADGTVTANASACGSGGGLSSYDAWTHPTAGVSATTSGMIIAASSTIGNGSQAGGLTISGGATTTGNLMLSSSGSLIDFNGGDVTLTHSSNALTLAGGNFSVGSNSVTAGSILASSNDSGALGASGTAWSDLFLASGGVVNWNGGDVTLTHAANTLTLAGASSGYVFSDGNVGIGTTTPFAKLAVQASAAQTNPVFEVASSSNATKFLSVAGDGFGTTTVTGLTINGSATTTSNVGLLLSGGCFATASGCITPIGSSSIEDLNDVAAMTENYGDLLFWNGSAWADLATSSLNLSVSALASLDFGDWTCNGSACTIDADAIALGTDTTGNYVATLASSGSITVGNGSTEGGAATVNLNLGNANTWTAQQNFYGTASSTLFSAHFATFGATASTTVDTAGNATIGNNLNVTGQTTLATSLTGLLKAASGVVSTATAGVDYVSGGRDWNVVSGYLAPTTTLGMLVSASSTIGNGTQAGGLTISGGATTTGNHAVSGALTVTGQTTLATSLSGVLKATSGVVSAASAGSDYVAGSGGSSNRVAFWSSASTISSDADLAFDGTTLTARDILIQHTAPILSINDSDSTGTDFRIDVNDGGAVFAADISAALTGEYFAFSTNNSEKLRLLENGLLGLGTTTPTIGQLTIASTTGAQLSLSAGAGFAQWALRNSLGTLYLAPSTVAGTATSTTALAILSSNNYVGIGTTTPNAKLEVVDSSAATTTALALTNYTAATSSTYVKLDFRTATSGPDTANVGTTTASIGSILLQNYTTAKGALAFSVLNSGLLTESARIDWTGYFGLGTTSPTRKLSVTDAVSTAQQTIAYDGTRYTDLLTDSVGDFTINPQGDDVRLNDDNLWVCTGGSCPTGSPSGTGNAIVESKLGVGTSTPNWSLQVAAARPFVALSDTAAGTNLKHWTISSQSGLLYIATSSDALATSTATALTINQNGFVGIGTTSPTQQLSVQNLLYVGANGASGMGTATSTFQGDIKIIGKLDVSTIDPPYTIDGTKYATYVASMIGVKEETTMTVSLDAYNTATKKYETVINFDDLEKDSDLWLFYQITTFGENWKELTVLLTPSFEGQVFYKKDIENNRLVISGTEKGEVSMRLTAARYDDAKWNNVRPDQDGNTEGTHVLTSKMPGGLRQAATAIKAWLR